MRIIGAGLSGLIAGALIPGSEIYERQSYLPNNHGAVLRFRSNKIARALNIPFKEVRVTKAIWYKGKEVPPSPRMQNYYSYKVTGQYGQRSINNIEPVTRYIAPPDFIARLGKLNKIHYDFTFPIGDFWNFYEPVISTIPLPVLLGAINSPYCPGQDFRRQSIWTDKLKFDNVDLYQTVYFPGNETPVYRASFTGDTLILEATADTDTDWVLDEVLNAFGIWGDWNREGLSTKEQYYGKIVEIDNSLRRSVLGSLTHDYNIYSLGRFATWRNILLDDVYEDIFKIMELVAMDKYSRRLAK